VIGAISRKGNVVLRVIDSTDTRTLDGFVHEFASNKVSLLCTDEHSGYRLLSRDLPHRIIRKSGDYVVGALHTNTIEGFRSILKRGVVGTYHKVSRICRCTSRNFSSGITIGRTPISPDRR
jgi:hypothetical protein